MDTLRLGRSIRALRRRLGWRQADLAARSGVSQSTISWLERGHAGGTSVDTLHSIARALDADVGLWLRWRGGDLDRLLDQGHAALGVATSALLRHGGWEVAPEVTYSVFAGRVLIRPDLTGIAVLVDGRWLVSRETVCNLLALNGIACPQDPYVAGS